MTTLDLMKLLGGVIVAALVGFFSYQNNYKPVDEMAQKWNDALKQAQEVYEASKRIKEDYDRYQKLSGEYNQLKQEYFGSSQSTDQDVFMSALLRNLENIVVEVRDKSKDNSFKLTNIRFGTISTRNIGGAEDQEGIPVRTFELSLNLTGKYSTIIQFFKELSNKDKVGSLIRIKTVSFSPTSVEVGKSPVNSVSVSIEMIQLLR
jgi:hypothetical protein